MSAAALTRGRAIGWTIAFFAVGAIVTIGVAVGAHALGVGGLGSEIIGELAGFGLATWLIGVRVLHLGAVQLRFRGTGPEGRGFGTGLGLGFGLAALAIILALATGSGWVRLPGTLGGWGAAVGATGGALLPAALAEEIIFRALALVVLASAFGRWPAIIALAILFGAAHLGNDHVTPLAAVNVGLAGVFLGMMFYLPGGIWSSTGAHLGWNLAQVALGVPVSGLPFAIPYLGFRSIGPEWVTGGAFGPEGGILATVVLAIAVGVLHRRSRKGDQA